MARVRCVVVLVCFESCMVDFRKIVGWQYCRQPHRINAASGVHRSRSGFRIVPNHFRAPRNGESGFGYVARETCGILWIPSISTRLDEVCGEPLGNNLRQFSRPLSTRDVVA
jgi:hypothetical protein